MSSNFASEESMSKEQFKIEQKLSESGTTIVYKAFDEMLHRRVLLKVLHKHLANDADLRQRFVREARACAALRSEHIVQIYDLTEIDGSPAIVMEFVEGKSLKEVIAQGNNRTVEFTRKVGIHVLRALAAAHDRGIIHRDIKPGNILISDNGIVKVTDFGLAYVALSPTVTMEGMVLGTPAYMAPEQVRGDVIDARTDLFALGVTLVEVLSGERIFEGSTYSECMKKVLAFKIEELKRFDIDSEPDFSVFLHKLLHPKQEDRFPSSRDALNVIDEKKSAAFIRPADVVQNRSLVSYGAVAAALIALLAFGWVKLFNSGAADRPIIPDPQTQNSYPTKDSLKEVAKTRIENKPIAILESRTPEKTVLSAPMQISKDSGRVFVTSSPWAKVFINNQLIGETPMAKPLRLAAGSHTIMFANPAFDPIVKTISVESDREITVDGNFLEQAGYLMCVVTPWAEVYVDEQYKDTTPLTKPLMLSAGKHTLRFKNAAYADIIKETTVRAQDTVHIILSFIK